ncbi:MAG: hypothetical protein CEE43_08055 [Promethearchaeota archaeon Loki_b32]|nr:hypothetical protein [Candidatus Lokiarchaeota archaeon]MCK4480677.1 hypothetical protein [Candidatus Lokiarchaeota archaeon]TKJ21886.1 MAG: hypothetical protein CEE43_08055 [Candidatus Lokiarchaeota archaeon Loki_b32]
MEIMEERLANSLNRINFIFRNEKIIAECIKNSEGFSLLGESFGPFEKGKKYKLKLFSAIQFIEKDILKVAPTEKCDNIDVQRYAISERDDPKLIKRSNSYFLNKIREFKTFMENEINKKNKPVIDLDRYNSYTSNIIDSRLLKLLKLSRAELSLEDERILTNSEKLLYDYLYHLIKIWRDFF